jgi:hypothetical protein
LLSVSLSQSFPATKPNPFQFNLSLPRAGGFCLLRESARRNITSPPIASLRLNYQSRRLAGANNAAQSFGNNFALRALRFERRYLPLLFVTVIFRPRCRPAPRSDRSRAFFEQASVLPYRSSTHLTNLNPIGVSRLRREQK